MSYNVDLQTNYPNTPYNWKGGSGKTIYTSGCCPSSVRNILVNLCGIKTSIKEMCNLARECGARVDGGTVPSTLLSAARKRYGGFTYEYTTSDSKARAHAAKGGMCLCHTTGANKVFSNSGHFVAMASAGARVTIIDPYVTSGKWSKYNRKSKVTTSGTKGVVYVTTATSDNSFDYYYLISKQANKQQSSDFKEVADMAGLTETDVRKIITKVATEQANLVVSKWAEKAFKAATDAKIMDGTSPQSPVTREQMAQVLLNAGVIGRPNDPSSWAENAFKAATDAGILDGTDPHGAVTREMLAVILQRVGLVGTGIVNKNTKSEDA